MQNPAKINNYTTGFTLLELIVVIAGLGILAGLAFPNFLKYLQYARNDEASSFLSALSSECLQNYRIDKASIDKTTKLLDRNGAPKDFKIEPENDKCSMTLISPANENDTVLASFGFMTKLRNGVPYIYKFGSYAHPDAEQACLNWASFKESNTGEVIQPKVRACDEGGNVEEIRARIAAEAAERARQAAEIERLRLIEEAFQKWLSGPPPRTGNYTSDGKNIWAVKGRVVAEDDFEAVLDRECGNDFSKALEQRKKEVPDGPYNYEKDGCKIDAYLCSGVDVQTKDGYDACKERERQELCTAERGKWIAKGVDGPFEPTNVQGCNKEWLCKGRPVTKAEYDEACGVTCKIEQVEVGAYSVFANKRWQKVPIYANRSVCR